MYSRIIEEVIQSSQVNFEEDGVDQQTLNEMRTVGLPSFPPWCIARRERAGLLAYSPVYPTFFAVTEPGMKLIVMHCSDHCGCLDRVSLFSDFGWGQTRGK